MHSWHEFPGTITQHLINQENSLPGRGNVIMKFTSWKFGIKMVRWSSCNYIIMASIHNNYCELHNNNNSIMIFTMQPYGLVYEARLGGRPLVV